MKRNFLDKLIGMFSPDAENKRIKARGKTEMLLRAYDAASTFNTDDWVSATGGSANSETRGAQTTLRNKGRDAIRNNPYANKGLNVIVANTVGYGIVPNIKGKTKLQTKRLKEAWKEWGETTLCDATGKNNFYGLQAQVIRSIAESGEVVVPKEISKDGFHLRVLESDYIVSNKETAHTDTGDLIIQGVKLDQLGRVKSFYIYESHPGESVSNLKEREVSSDKILHVYRQDRPGQLRGISWFHPVIRQLEDFKEYQQATLISRKIGACFTAFVTTNDQDSTLSPADLKAKREAETMLSPGQVRYLANGESVEIATPPSISGYDEFCRQTLRAIASGLGITYEALTSDYSQVNFSSGRMGHLEFRKNVEAWRWQMLIPQFCEPSFKHFLDWCRIAKGIQVEGVTCEWVAPAWSMIDPTKEISAMKEAVRAGFTSRPKVVLELGYDPDQLDEEIAESNQKTDELKLIFDSDPRRVTGAGILQVDPTASSSQGNNNVQENSEADSPIGGSDPQSN